MRTMIEQAVYDNLKLYREFRLEREKDIKDLEKAREKITKRKKTPKILKK